VKIKINRAPVLTLWAAIVAERLGFDAAEALTLGKALAGYTAQTKGQLLGIYHPRESSGSDSPEREEPQREAEVDLVFVNLMGRSLPAVITPDGVRAVERGRPADPENARRYLQGKFGEALAPTERAMRALAAAYPADRLDVEAYRLYERFRPVVEKGKAGWGAQGELDLDKILGLRPKA
jgi:hypothetical protein